MTAHQNRHQAGICRLGPRSSRLQGTLGGGKSVLAVKGDWMAHSIEIGTDPEKRQRGG